MVWFYLITARSGLQKAWRLSIPLWSDFILTNSYCCFGKITAFNPTMVWFYLKNDEIRELYWEHFQSHYGLILSNISISSPKPINGPFNPTMVWFYLAYEKYTTLFIVNFQSHYGLILSETVGVHPFHINAFNPTMVWFYHTVVTAASTIHIVTFNPTMVWFYLSSIMVIRCQ